jgi:photosystem II stability/assembly factor-like uncharacterized protein
MHVRLILPALSFLLSVVLAGPPALTGQDGPDEALAALEFRSIGPAIMGGRVAAIAGVPGDQLTFYFGHASGGVFRTRNGGVTFEPIFDEIGVPSIGAIAVAPSDPNVIYVGTGEGNPRNSASVGRGVWRSVDAGETWTSLGLGGTEKITRIRIHPTDPDVVYVAALGHEWGDHPDRGIFRSTDGGATWDRILYVDDTTGAADLAMDPANPRILYAAMYDFRRQPWYFRSGGPGSGLWRSADGGDTWEALTDAAPDNGLPEGALGRIGVAVAPSDADVVYAMIESTHDGQVWRSDDRGRTWRVVTEDGNVNSRPFYFTDMRVDPATSERLYSLSGRLMVSTDGGRTWERLGEDIHPDHQSMWIDPEDPRFILNGNDGGVYLSRDRGESFQYLNRVPLGQFYQIGADMRDPYWVFGDAGDRGPGQRQLVHHPLRRRLLRPDRPHGLDHRLHERPLREHRPGGPDQRREAVHPALSGLTPGRRGRRSPVPVQLELTHPSVAPRSDGGLFRLQRPPSDRRRGAVVDRDQPRPDHRRSRQADRIGRTDHD